MKVVITSLIIHSLIISSTAASVRGRYLQENEGEGGESADGGGEYQDGNNGSGNIAVDFEQRIENDLTDMWDTAPSSWVTEYWEVFASLLTVTFLLLICHCCMAYDVCCSSSSQGDISAGGRKTMTQGEYNTRKEKDNPIDRDSSAYEPPIQLPPAATSPRSQLLAGSPSELDETYKSVDSGREDLVAIGTIESEKRIGGTSKSGAPFANSEAGGQAAKSSSPRKSSKSDERSGRAGRLVSEIVSVWSEFLGFQKPLDDFQDTRGKYHRYNDPTSPKSMQSKKKKAESILV